MAELLRMITFLFKLEKKTERKGIFCVFNFQFHVCDFSSVLRRKENNESCRLDVSFCILYSADGNDR